ncbi:MAG: hypothetical protein V2A73_18690 [Pseudomonadota bacterium]
MKMEGILAELEGTADKLGVKLTYESLGDGVSGGGLCKVRGAPRVIIERRSSLGEKVATLAKALASLGVEGMHLSTDARQIVELYRRETP